MSAVDDLRALGYRVEFSNGPTPAHVLAEHAENGLELVDDSDTPTIYFVEGEGVQTYLRDDDEDAWRSLIDGHDGRVAQREAVAELADLDLSKTPRKRLEEIADALGLPLEPKTSIEDLRRQLEARRSTP